MPSVSCLGPASIYSHVTAFLPGNAAQIYVAVLPIMIPLFTSTPLMFDIAAYSPSLCKYYLDHKPTSSTMESSQIPATKYDNFKSKTEGSYLNKLRPKGWRTSCN